MKSSSENDAPRNVTTDGSLPKVSGNNLMTQEQANARYHEQKLCTANKEPVIPPLVFCTEAELNRRNKAQ